MSQYYDLETLLAFPGATVAITLLCGAVAYLGGEKAKPFLKWVALGAAFLLSGAGWLTSSPVGLTWQGGLVAAFNSAVLFLASVGANTITTKPEPQARAMLDAAPRRFNTRWLA